MPHTHGIDIKKEFGLFDHQVEGIEFLMKNKRSILAHEMGLGKSRMAAIAAGISSKAGILVICPASLKINWEREIHMVYPEDEVCIVGTGPEIDLNPVWIVINYDMLQKYLGQILALITKKKIDTAIVDECFIPGTLVDTPKGPIPIEKIKIGDEVMNAIGIGIVRNVGQKGTSYLVEVVTKNGSFVCTPDHKFFTNHGWVKACHLWSKHYIIGTYEAMRMVQEALSTSQKIENKNTKVLWQNLLCEVEQVTARCDQKNIGNKQEELSGESAKSDGILNKDDCKEPDEKKDHKDESFSDAQKDRSSSKSERGKRNGHDGTRKNNDGVVSYGRMELSNSNTSVAPERISASLQSRHRISEDKIGDRNRWKLTQTFEKTEAGQKEGLFFERARVVHVKVLKREDIKKYGNGHGSAKVYNLEVSGHPSYSVNGLLVHNCHYIKGRKTIRSEAVLSIAKDLENIYCLTGTPVMNRPVELFNLLKAIKHPLSKTRTEFTKRYCGAQLKTLVRDQMMHRTFFVNPENSYAFRAQKNRYRVMTFLDDKGATHLDELHENTKESILRRTKKEVLDLPEKIISFQLCELDSAKQKEYEEAWEVYLHWIETHPEEEKDIDNIMMAQHLVEIGKLKQVCSLSKTKRIADDIENAVDQDEKVIVFSQYTQTVYELERELTARKIKWVQLTGENSQDERQWAVDEFQTKDETKVFIANIKAGGVGLNLTAASIVMFADMEWSPEIHAQAEDRAHRIGQEGTVNIYYYVTKDTIEEDIAEVLDQKRGVIQEVMDGKRSQKSMASDILKRIKEKRQ